MYSLPRKGRIRLLLIFLLACYSAILTCSLLNPRPADKTVETKLEALNSKYLQALNKRDALLTTLFGKKPNAIWQSTQVTITWYSLSKDECDNNPDEAAHGKSRPFMAAISPKVVKALGLVPGDKVAVVSDDGEIAVIVVYWDGMNSRYDNQSRVDIVAPSKEVAKRWAMRSGKVIKV